MVSRAATLGSPLQLRGVELRNRVVGAPMERNYGDLAGRATSQYVAYLGARARGGAGLLFTEASYVRQDSKARLRQLGLHGDHVIPQLTAVADDVHRRGARLGVELNHAGRVVPAVVSQRQPVAPTAVPCTEISGEMPRALATSEIDDVIDAYAAAAARAVAAGADMLSLHAAHGYLVGQSLSPRSNRRSDVFARPVEFLDRVLVAVREVIPAKVPLFLRWSAFEGLPGGRDVDDSLETLLSARLDLVDVVDLSAGTYGAGHWITPSGEVEEGYVGSVARRYREEAGLRVSVAGRITSPRVAAHLVESGQVDLVSVARALHADPEWSRHALAGTEPRPCISCNQGCVDVVFTGLPLWCTANPSTGREASAAPEGRAAARRPFVVVGGGPAGMEAAVTLAEAGADVTVYEASDRLGGQLLYAAALKAKPQFGRLLDWYASQLEWRSVRIELGAKVDPYSLNRGLTVIDATGGVDYVPEPPASSTRRVVGIRAWLGEAPAVPEHLVFWGADRCAVFVADELVARGHAVTIVGTQSDLAPDAGARERLPAVTRLSDSSRVTLMLGHTLERVLEDSLVLSCRGEHTVVHAPRSDPRLTWRAAPGQSRSPCSDDRHGGQRWGGRGGRSARRSYRIGSSRGATAPRNGTRGCSGTARAHRMNRIVVSTYTGLWRSGFAKLLRDLAGQGHDAVEVLATHPHVDLDDVESAIEALGTACRATGVAVSSVVPSGIDVNLASTSKEMRAWSMLQFRRTIRLAAALSAPQAIVHPGRRHPLRPPPLDVLVSWVEGALEVLVEEAAREGVELLVENVPTGLFDTVQECLRLIEPYGGRVRLCYDVANGFMVEDVPVVLRAAGSHVGLVHLSDRTTSQWLHAPLGSGAVPWEQVVAVLREKRYETAVVLETLHEQEPAAGFASDLSVLIAAGLGSRATSADVSRTCP